MPFGVIGKVRKVFPGGEPRSAASEPVVALDDASFQFEEGELVALLGPSGCGKTTLLRIVGGLIQKTSGSVRIGGREIVRPTGDYGFVFQAPSLMPWRSEYLKWRIETYSGRKAESINALQFWQFVWQEKGNLIRFLAWTSEVQRPPHHQD